MAQVEIISERERGRGWEFDVQVLDDGGALRKHLLTLSWADYNLWSVDGADEPSKVAEAVMSFMAQRFGVGQVPSKLDASIARKGFADADREIPKLIRR